MFVRIDPFNEMSSMFRDFDTLFMQPLDELRLLSAGSPGRRLQPAGATTGAQAQTSLGAPRPGWTGTFRPAVECFTRDKNLVVRVELPGVEPGDVEVSVMGDQLVIRGEKREQHQADEIGVHYREIALGRFERSFTLPEGARTDQVKAAYTNGVLEITVPAAEILEARKVPVEVSESTKKAIKAA